MGLSVRMPSQAIGLLIGGACLLAAAAAQAQPCPTFFAALTTGVVSDVRVNEASGLVASEKTPGIFWTHNDSGDSPRIFALAADGTLVATYTLDGAGAQDWEDLARGPGPAPGIDYLYLADIGDNPGARSFVTVYRVPEPALDLTSPGAEGMLGAVVALEMEYPDGAHDAETLLSDPLTGDLYIVAKCTTATGCSNGVNAVYRYPAPHSAGMRATLTRLTPTVDFPSSPQLNNYLSAATAGDISADGTQIAVRTYTQARRWIRTPGQSIAEALEGTPCSLPIPGQPQGETLAFSIDGTSYSTLSEFTGQPILRTDARGADQFLPGHSLRVQDPGAGYLQHKRKVSVRALDDSDANTLVGDPVRRGAVLEIQALGGTPSTQSFILPPGTDTRGKPFWRALGNKGFRYLDARGERGSVKKILLRRSSNGRISLKLSLHGKNGTLDIQPPAPGTEAYASLRFPGGDRYCVKFGTDAVEKKNGITTWLVRGGTSEGCPPD